MKNFKSHVVQALACLITLVTLPAHAASSRIYATIQFTNNPAQSNTFVVLGQSRMFLTNVTNSASQVLLTNNVGGTVTNTYLDIVGYPFTNNVEIQYGTNTNSIVLIGRIDAALSVTFSTNNFATVSYKTNPVYAAEKVAMPFTVEGPTNRLLIASGLISAIENWATNSLSGTNAALTNYANLKGTQTLGQKYITNSTIFGSLLTNDLIGHIMMQLWAQPVSPTNYSPELTNASTLRFYDFQTNYMFDVRPDRDGFPSLFLKGTRFSPQFGNEITNYPAAYMTIGHAMKFLPSENPLNGPFWTRQSNVFSIQNIWSSTSNTFLNGLLLPGGFTATGGLLTNANGAFAGLTATNLQGKGGNLTNFSGAFSALTATNLQALGGNITNMSGAFSSLTATNLQANGGNLTNMSGAFSALTATNLQAAGGNLTNMSIAASSLTATNLQATSGTLTNVNTVNGFNTNAAFSGSNVFRSTIVYPPRASASLANGNNAGVNLGTNTYIRLSGATTIATICGFAAGADGEHKIVRLNGAVTNIIANQSGVDPVVANRITTATGADVSSTNNPVYLDLIYNGGTPAWELITIR